MPALVRFDPKTRKPIAFAGTGEPIPVAVVRTQAPKAMRDAEAAIDRKTSALRSLMGAPRGGF